MATRRFDNPGDKRGKTRRIGAKPGEGTRRIGSKPSSAGKAGAGGKKYFEDDEYEYYEVEVKDQGRGGRSRRGNDSVMVIVGASIGGVLLLAFLFFVVPMMFGGDSNDARVAATTTDLRTMKSAVDSMISAQDTDGLAKAARHFKEVVLGGKVSNIEQWRQEVGKPLAKYLERRHTAAYEDMLPALFPNMEVRDAKTAEMEEQMHKLDFTNAVKDVCEAMDMDVFKSRVMKYIDRTKLDPLTVPMLDAGNTYFEGAFFNAGFVKNYTYYAQLEIKLKGKLTDGRTAVVGFNAEVPFDLNGTTFRLR